MDVSQAIEVVSLTDPGKLRSRNEDYVTERRDCGLVVLADGMGGYNAGEVASGMASELLADGLQLDWSQLRLDHLDKAQMRAQADRLLKQHAERANTAVYKAAQSNEEYAGMGTTLVLGLFYDDVISVGHIGDSRMYRLRGEQLQQLTKDHSLLQEHIDQGLITPEQARLSQNKNLVTRALGVDPHVDMDVSCHEVEPGDIYLLCSDGLNDMVDEEEIRLTLLTLTPNLPLAAQHLVQAANDNGGRDNISVIAVKALRRFPITQSWVVRFKSWFKR